jgi:hypothetical protein
VTSKRPDIGTLPYWPRCLSRDQAAAYVGVSPNIFDMEVATGQWPVGDARGAKGGRLTWDRFALDRRLDARLGSEEDYIEDDFDARRRAAEASTRRKPDRKAS